MINIIIKIFLIVLFLSANGYEDDNFKVCPGKEDSFANSKLARRFQVKGNVFACKECEECDEYKINALYSSDIEKNIADGGFLEDYVSYKETEENTENTGTCETLLFVKNVGITKTGGTKQPIVNGKKTTVVTKPTEPPFIVTNNSEEGILQFIRLNKVKVKTVLKVDNIVFNQNLTITLCAGKSTNSCDEKVLEMFYSMTENKIFSKDHMYKLKETDKNKNFDALNGEQFNLNFIVQEKSIIVNFLEDGTANLNLTFTTGASAEELEINLLQLDKVIDVIKTETVRFPHSITIEAENHLKPKNNLKFMFEFTKMKSTYIAIFLLQHVAGDIKPGNIIDIVGSPTKLKAYLNKDGGNKISFMLLFEFPKDDKSTKDEPTTGFVHLITQSTGKGEKGDITDNVTAVYVKKENKEISFKINFGGGKADRIIKLAVTFSQDESESLEIERSVPKIELSKISRIFIVGSQQDVMLLQADILEPKK